MHKILVNVMREVLELTTREGTENFATPICRATNSRSSSERRNAR